MTKADELAAEVRARRAVVNDTEMKKGTELESSQRLEGSGVYFSDE